MVSGLATVLLAVAASVLWKGSRADVTESATA
jgi:hypothetical protein